MNLEEHLVTYCAPTLAAIKTGNLFQYHPRTGVDVRQELLRYERLLAAYGVSLAVMKHCRRNNGYLLYVCRRDALCAALARGDIRSFLRQYGYHPEYGLDACLRHLSGRVCMMRDFPHEIGVFLGYPLHDVEGFIRNKGKGHLCVGHWKVYADLESAERCFARYNACTARYKAEYRRGRSLEELTAAQCKFQIPYQERIEVS